MYNAKLVVQFLVHCMWSMLKILVHVRVASWTNSLVAMVTRRWNVHQDTALLCFSAFLGFFYLFIGIFLKQINIFVSKHILKLVTPFT